MIFHPLVTHDWRQVQPPPPSAWSPGLINSYTRGILLPMMMVMVDAALDELLDELNMERGTIVNTYALLK